MPVESIRSVVQAAIQRASAATGVDFGFLMGTAKRESNYNPAAKAGSSSAAGLFQFVDQTWMATLKTHGAKHGYARYADLIERGSDGRYRVANADAKKAVMELRMDARAASLMAGELTSENAAYLRGRVGRNPTGGELYIAHFLGPAGSAKLIQAKNANPAASASALFPDAARANPSIFYRAGRPATVAEVYANLTSAGGHAPAATADPAPQKAFIEYASGRRLDRIEQEKALVDLVLRGSQEPESLTNSIMNSAMLRAAAYARNSREG